MGSHYNHSEHLPFVVEVTADHWIMLKCRLQHWWRSRRKTKKEGGRMLLHIGHWHVFFFVVITPVFQDLPNHTGRELQATAPLVGQNRKRGKKHVRVKALSSLTWTQSTLIYTRIVVFHLFYSVFCTCKFMASFIFSSLKRWSLLIYTMLIYAYFPCLSWMCVSSSTCQNHWKVCPFDSPPFLN